MKSVRVVFQNLLKLNFHRIFLVLKKKMILMLQTFLANNSELPFV